MEKYSLSVQKRDASGKGVARSLRRSALIPAVVYRAGAAQPVQIGAKELSQFISKTAGEQVLVTLNIGSDAKLAVVKDYQLDPINGELLHVDFQEILATETIKINVHIITTGEAIGVKRDKGRLQHGIRDIEIECLPDQIMGHITVDVSKLEINKVIHVSDLNLPEGIKILTDGHEVIASVVSVKEEVVAVADAVATPAEPEVIKKGKKEEAAG